MKQVYNRFILEYPHFILILIGVVIIFFGYQARNLEIDASSESLLLEDDQDLALSRLFAERFQSPDFLVITITPQGDLPDSKNLDIIRRLSVDLLKLDQVESVTSILNVPLLESPPRPVKEMIKHIPVLETPGIDKTLVKKGHGLGDCDFGIAGDV